LGLLQKKERRGRTNRGYRCGTPRSDDSHCAQKVSLAMA